MPVSACPVSIARAPATTVWQLLIEPSGYGAWADAHVESVSPPGPAAPGQLIQLRAPRLGGWFSVRLTVLGVDAARHAITLTGNFPFGLRMTNRLSVTAIDDSSSRVQFA